MTTLTDLGALELLAGYRRAAFSPVEVLEAVAARVEAASGLGVYITTTLDAALEAAQAAASVYASRASDPPPLLGVPVAVKDNYETAGVRTTYGSSIFAAHVPDADARCVERLRAAGALVVGKTNLHEFAWGVTGVNPHYGLCRDPWDPERIAGGSSGGSAAAVALRHVPLALGSDTAGSIRIPAAICGVTGLRPSAGRLPRDGLFPLAPSLDEAGLLARDPRDLALALAVLEGVPSAGPLAAGLAGSGPPAGALHGLRVGVLRGAPTPREETALAAALAVLTELGGRPLELDEGVFDGALEAFVPLQQAEALAVHQARGLFPARAAEYGADVRERLEQSLSVTPAAVQAAKQARAALRARLQAVFADVDILLTPADAMPAPAVAGLDDPGAAAGFRARTLACTVPQSLAGLPACVVRAGFDDEGLPVGVQLTGRGGEDERLLAVAAAFWAATAGVQSRWPEEPAV